MFFCQFTCQKRKVVVRVRGVKGNKQWAAGDKTDHVVCKSFNPPSPRPPHDVVFTTLNQMHHKLMQLNLSHFHFGRTEAIRPLLAVMKY